MSSTISLLPLHSDLEDSYFFPRCDVIRLLESDGRVRVLVDAALLTENK